MDYYTRNVRNSFWQSAIAEAKGIFLIYASVILKISFWEYSFIMNKHNQKPTDIFNKQDVTVYLR